MWFSQHRVYSGCATCLLEIKTNDKAEKCIDMVRDSRTNNREASHLGVYGVDTKLYFNYIVLVWT